MFKDTKQASLVYLNIGVLLLEVLSSACDGTTSSNASYKDIDFPISSFPDLGSGCFIVYLTKIHEQISLNEQAE